MRLLNTKTLQLDTFSSTKHLNYAILSHTWGKDEVLFEDIRHGSRASWRHKTGCSKVLAAADLAREMRYNHLWIDSCCIDKSSSAELSEAINSMYEWYQQSAICFTYLQDVKKESFNKDFPRCRWFERGWTLQELIAPKFLQFYDANWTYLGSRRDLAGDIEKITQISRPILLKDMALWEVSVSCRMAWAAGRITTRKEDGAYSLMGIFDVNMPLLYGEGDKAFHRLQEEIIRRSNDHTVLLSGIIANFPTKFAVLAPSLDCFRQGREFVKPFGPISSYFHIQGNTLQISLLIAPLDYGHVLGILDSSYANDPTNLSRPALLLEECHGLYTRANMDIFRVTPIDSYTANVKSDSREFRLELNAVRRQTVTLSLTPVIAGHRALTEGAHHILRLSPIMQGHDEFYRYGPCYPSPSESLLRLLDAYIYIEEKLCVRGCVSLFRPNQENPCVIIWILEQRHFHPDDSDHAVRVAMCDMKGALPAESHQLSWDEKGILELLARVSRQTIPLEHADESGTTFLTTADDVEVSAKITVSQFLGRRILDLEISCMPGKHRHSGPAPYT
ncbi:heterokaryon incompatibility protein-domain-containing protein [Xylaria intraflava]|nr:heterokaryon incompatibility protein-domain-containing protein [Xylaria intraflava]